MRGCLYSRGCLYLSSKVVCTSEVVCYCTILSLIETVSTIDWFQVGLWRRWVWCVYGNGLLLHGKECSPCIGQCMSYSVVCGSLHGSHDSGRYWKHYYCHASLSGKDHHYLTRMNMWSTCKEICN